MKLTFRSIGHIPLICLILLTFLNALFWFMVDFQSFSPPSDGLFRERIILFIVTELGPLTSFMFPLKTSDYFYFGAIGLFFISMLFGHLRFPKVKLISAGLCIGLLLWFFVGFIFTSTRIT